MLEVHYQRSSSGIPNLLQLVVCVLEKVPENFNNFLISEKAILNQNAKVPDKQPARHLGDLFDRFVRRYQLKSGKAFYNADRSK